MVQESEIDKLSFYAGADEMLDRTIKHILAEPSIDVPRDERRQVTDWIQGHINRFNEMKPQELKSVVVGKQPLWQIATMCQMFRDRAINNFTIRVLGGKLTFMVDPLVPGRVFQLQLRGVPAPQVLVQ
jgi:hypothetical protein